MALSSADKQARNRFQSGLLAWLRAEPEAAASAGGLREMIAVARGRIEEDDANALLWRSAEAFLKALLDGSLQTEENARQLCRRIERHLAGRSDDSPPLVDAIFAFVSNRIDNTNSATAPAVASEPIASEPPVKPVGALHETLGAAADLLPLLGDRRRRFSGALHSRWQEIAGRLRDDWHAQLTGADVTCRSVATELVALSLELNESAALSLAEAIADAAAACEDRANLEAPALRAAFSAALEVLAEPDGPEQSAFPDKARHLVQRLAQALAGARSKPALAARPPWFADDAHEWLNEMAAALEAVPPKRLTLLAGFDWLAQQEGTSGMAVRGLSILASKLVRQMRADDLDQGDRHRLLGDVLAALTGAIDDLASGQPGRPDEEIFARLRALEQEVTRLRGARSSPPAAPSSGPPVGNSPPAPAGQ